MPDPVIPPKNPYDFASTQYVDGERSKRTWTGDPLDNTLIGFGNAFAPMQDSLNKTAQASFAEMAADPSDLAAVGKYQADNCAMMTLFSVQSNTIKGIYEKGNELAGKLN